jgi:hypothetical protein
MRGLTVGDWRRLPASYCSAALRAATIRSADLPVTSHSLAAVMGTRKWTQKEQPRRFQPARFYSRILHLLKADVVLSAKLGLRHPTVLANNPNVLAHQCLSPHRLILSVKGRIFV